jgi:hypothetical protein
VIVALPADTAVTSPLASTVATAPSLDDQITALPASTRLCTSLISADS